MDAADKRSYAVCLLRELQEEAILPEDWWAAAKAAVRQSPTGHFLAMLTQPSRNRIHLVAHWVVRVQGSRDLERHPSYTSEGRRESVEGSAAWWPMPVVRNNLEQFNFLQPMMPFLQIALQPSTGKPPRRRGPKKRAKRQQGTPY